MKLCEQISRFELKTRDITRGGKLEIKVKNKNRKVPVLSRLEMKIRHKPRRNRTFKKDKLMVKNEEGERS